jgi:predicted dehydrogenase
MKLAILSFAHHHAEAYAQILQTMSGVDLFGVADADADRGRYFAERLHTRYFPSYAALLHEKPDGVLVCSENAGHRELVEMAADAGVHVLCEKPLATTLDDAQSMIDACRRANVVLMTAFPMRFSAPLLEVQTLLEQDGLGQIYACNTTNQGQLPLDHRAWFVDKRLAGGGAVMDHTVHLVDVLRWYLQSEVVEVYAATNHIIHRSTVSVETGGLLLLTFANGVFATIDCSWSRPARYPTWGGLALKLIGERGVINVDAFRQTMAVHGNVRQHTRWMYWGSDANRAMLEDFVLAIQQGRSPRVRGEDGYRALEVVLAAYESAEKGAPVRLAE